MKKEFKYFLDVYSVPFITSTRHLNKQDEHNFNKITNLATPHTFEADTLYTIWSITPKRGGLKPFKKKEIEGPRPLPLAVEVEDIPSLYILIRNPHFSHNPFETDPRKKYPFLWAHRDDFKKALKYSCSWAKEIDCVDNTPPPDFNGGKVEINIHNNNVGGDIEAYPAWNDEPLPFNKILYRPELTPSEIREEERRYRWSAGQDLEPAEWEIFRRAFEAWATQMWGEDYKEWVESKRKGYNNDRELWYLPKPGIKYYLGSTVFDDPKVEALDEEHVSIECPGTHVEKDTQDNPVTAVPFYFETERYVPNPAPDLDDPQFFDHVADTKMNLDFTIKDPQGEEITMRVFSPRKLYGHQKSPVNQIGRKRMIALEVNFKIIGPDWANLVALRAVRNAEGTAELWGIYQSNNTYSPSEIIIDPQEKTLDMIPYPAHLPPPEQIEGLIDVDAFPPVRGMENHFYLKYNVKSKRSERILNFLQAAHQGYRNRIVNATEEHRIIKAITYIKTNQTSIDTEKIKGEKGELSHLLKITAELPEGLQAEIEALWENVPLYESQRVVHMPLPWPDITKSIWGKFLKYSLFGLPLYLFLKWPFVNLVINVFRFKRYNQNDLWMNLIPKDGIKKIDKPRYEYKSPFWRFITTYPLNTPLLRNRFKKTFEKSERGAALNRIEKFITKHVLYYHEIKVKNYFPTTISYPHHKGWLNPNHVFRLKEKYSITDLVDLVKYRNTGGLFDIPKNTSYWIGPNPDNPGTLSWSAVKPENRQGWREVKNAGLGLLKLEGAKDEEQVVIPFEDLPSV